MNTDQSGDPFSEIVGYLVTHPFAYIIFIAVCLIFAVIGGGGKGGGSGGSGLGSGGGKSPGSDLFD
jgi:hypothetical protein